MTDAAAALLTPAERRTLAYLAHGATNEQIAVRLDRSVSTVAGYRRTAHERLNVHSSGAAVHRAFTMGAVIAAPLAGYDDMSLSPREWEVLIGIALDMPIGDVAVYMGVTLATARTHRGRLYAKLGARSAAHAVGIGHRTGMLTHCPTCRARRVIEELQLDWTRSDERTLTCTPSPA